MTDCIHCPPYLKKPSNLTNYFGMLADDVVWNLDRTQDLFVSFLDVSSLMSDDLNNSGPEQLRTKLINDRTGMMGRLG